MKNKKTIANIALSLLVVGGIFFTVYSINDSSFSFIANENDFLLTLDSSSKISNENEEYIDEKEGRIKTKYNNQITVYSSNLLNNNSGWQSLKPYGYFYNPILEDDLNKISGLKSIEFKGDSGDQLSLYCGYTLNNESIVYSYKKALTANTPLVLDESHYSYFYIENESNKTINISELSFSYSCIDTVYPKKDYKILMIGNSFADDTVYYAKRVAESYGINLTIYDAYIAGCTIDMHYTNLQNGSTSYSMRSTNGGSWDYKDNKSLGEIIDYDTWDLITFQQASAEVGRPSSYSNLSNLVGLVRNRVGSGPVFKWYQTWAYDKDYHDYYDYFSYFDNDQEAMYEAINSCYTNQVKPLNLFDGFIPSGTAVQNLRTSYMKDTFTRDGKHMSSVHGRYLLSLNLISNIFEISLNKSPCPYLPNEINQSFKPVLVESIMNAATKPLECTSSAYTNGDISKYDLSNYTEIDAGLLGCSFWNSTDSSNFNKRQSNVLNTSNLYVSSSRFTPSTLPIGSIVSIDEGFGFRPEAWVNDSMQSNRPDESYANIVEIDSSFWDGYQYRAFNIFKAGKTTLLGEYVQIFDGVHIYVPNNKIEGIKTKNQNDFYDSDKMVFKSSNLNIDAFERLHLDPITGFYKCDSYYELTNSYVDDTAKKFLCTRPFYKSNGDLPQNTVILVDSGYQWRSDCWKDHGSYSPRPDNVSSNLTILDESFWGDFRRRTFNVSSTSSSYVGQNYLSFMEHLRIYVPISEDILMPKEDTATMTALGYASINGIASSYYGKSEIPILITLHGDSLNKAKVEVDGSDIGATSYTYNKNTGAITINTVGSAGNYSFGTINGTISKENGQISNIRASGTISQFITNNGSIICKELYFDRCNYSSSASSQEVWQRWYMSGSWQANSGSGDWTTSSGLYLLDNDYSMGLRIANNSYGKTRFTLKNDLNNGNGLTPKGISLWLYNPNGSIYNRMRVYVYKTASTYSNGHAVPSSSYSQVYETTSLASNEWVNIKFGLNSGTIYNISLYFETSSSSTTYLYLGHFGLY